MESYPETIVVSKNVGVALHHPAERLNRYQRLYYRISRQQKVFFSIQRTWATIPSSKIAKDMISLEQTPGHTVGIFVSA